MKRGHELCPGIVVTKGRRWLAGVEPVCVQRVISD